MMLLRLIEPKKDVELSLERRYVVLQESNGAKAQGKKGAGHKHK